MARGRLGMSADARWLRSSELAQNLVLSAGPEGTRDVESPPASGGQTHRPHPPVGMRRALDQTIALEQNETACECRLIDGARVLELFDARLPHGGTTGAPYGAPIYAAGTAQ